MSVERPSVERLCELAGNIIEVRIPRSAFFVPCMSHDNLYGGANGLYAPTCDILELICHQKSIFEESFGEEFPSGDVAAFLHLSPPPAAPPIFPYTRPAIPYYQHVHLLSDPQGMSALAQSSDLNPIQNLKTSSSLVDKTLCQIDDTRIQFESGIFSPELPFGSDAQSLSSGDLLNHVQSIPAIEAGFSEIRYPHYWSASISGNSISKPYYGYGPSIVLLGLDVIQNGRHDQSAPIAAAYDRLSKKTNMQSRSSMEAVYSLKLKFDSNNEMSRLYSTDALSSEPGGALMALARSCTIFTLGGGIKNDNDDDGNYRPQNNNCERWEIIPEHLLDLGRLHNGLLVAGKIASCSYKGPWKDKAQLLMDIHNLCNGSFIQFPQKDDSLISPLWREYFNLTENLSDSIAAFQQDKKRDAVDDTEKNALAHAAADAIGAELDDPAPSAASRRRSVKLEEPQNKVFDSLKLLVAQATEFLMSLETETGSSHSASKLGVAANIQGPSTTKRVRLQNTVNYAALVRNAVENTYIRLSMVKEEIFGDASFVTAHCSYPLPRPRVNEISVSIRLGDIRFRGDNEIDFWVNAETIPEGFQFDSGKRLEADWGNGRRMVLLKRLSSIQTFTLTRLTPRCAFNEVRVVGSLPSISQGMDYTYALRSLVGVANQLLGVQKVTSGVGAAPMAVDCDIWTVMAAQEMGGGVEAIAKPGGCVVVAGSTSVSRARRGGGAKARGGRGGRR